ncbi:MAG: amidohydrolase [Bacteroidales bacterium]|nr:amidohydrolase [Bacteroidales bacterium]
MKTHRNHLFHGLMIMAILVTNCNPMKQTVDMIVYNAHVYTVNEKFETVEAFAVNDGRFLAMGTTDEILFRFESANTINALGKPVYPGFNDGHCHFYGYGENSIRYADLSGTKSFDEVLERLKRHAEKFPSEWLLGRGWDQNTWETKQFPDNDDLEKLFPGKKVYLIRIDGHAALVSKQALKSAGINENYRIIGGEVITNEQGEASGILLDNAMDTIRDLIPALTAEQKETALVKAQQDCFAVGLTSVTDAGLSYQVIDLIAALQLQDKLKMKMNVMLTPDSVSLARFLPFGPKVTERLIVRSIKLYADGALGSRGAKLLLPYSDETDKTGMIMFEKDYYEKICKQAYEAGFQVNMHAIGDSANRMALNIFGSFLNGKNDLRWRIEHAQVVDPADFELFGKYSIIPSVQSTHCTSDMGWADERLGPERIKTAYTQKQLILQNGWLINGTDFPIESINPVNTFYAAVARKSTDGFPVNGFQTENALNREEALRSITIWPAKGAFEELVKGSIEINKYADFVILDRDIMMIPSDSILLTKVLRTVSSGEIVYE